MKKILNALLILVAGVLLLKPISGLANSTPEAQDDITATKEDTPLNINVLINNGNGADTFGDDGPNTGRIKLPVNTTARGGSLSVDDAGTPNDPTDDTVDYVPAINFNGSDNFEYIITDSNGDSDSATVSIDVAAVNDIPTANDDLGNTRENTPVNLQPLLNDDFGGDASSNDPIIIISPPNNGSASVNDNGTPNDPTDDSIDYLPNTDFSGIDQLSYRLCDIDNHCAEANIQIDVTDTNDVPTARDDLVSTNEDQSITIAVLEDNANGVDDFGNDGPNAGTISLPETHSLNGGTLNLDDGRTADNPEDDRVNYTPPANFSGSDSFIYLITDANGDMSSALVTINVIEVNDLPQAQDDSVTTAEDMPLTVLVLSNNGNGVDSFGGEGPNTGSILLPNNSTDQGGSVVVNDSGTAADPTDDTVVYTPAADFFGDDTFEYIITDASGDTSTATVLVNITPENDLPLAQDDQFSIRQYISSELNVLQDNGNGSDDFGGDGPNKTGLSLPGNLSANGASLMVNTAGTPDDPLDDTVTYVPVEGFTGTDTFEYIITDSDNDTSTATVTITISDATLSPTAQIPTASSWGLIIMSMLLSIITFVKRRKLHAHG